MALNGVLSKVPKRSAEDDGMGNSGGISDDDIKSLLAEHSKAHEVANAKLLSDIHTQTSTANSKLLADVGVLVDKKCAKLERTAKQHEERIGATEDRQRLLEKRQDDFAREHKSLAEQLSIAKTQIIERADVESDNFDRPPNLQMIRITAKKALTIEAGQKLSCSWAQ